MYDEASLACQRSLGTDLLETGLDAAWFSTLVERHRSGAGPSSVDTQPTPDLHLIVALRGRHEIDRLEDGRWRKSNYAPGAVGLIAGGQVQHLRRSSEAGFEVGHVYVPRRHVLEAAEALRRAGQPTSERSLTGLRFDDPTIVTTVTALLAAARSGAPDLYADQAMHWLAMHLLVTHGNADERALRSRRRLTDAALSRVIEMVLERFAAPLSLDALASEANVSKFHFARLFRERTGSPPHAFLVETRMAAARRFLADTDLPIAEVARQCGYARPVQFGVAFKRRHDLTPTEFRRLRDGQRVHLTANGWSGGST